MRRGPLIVLAAIVVIVVVLNLIHGSSSSTSDSAAEACSTTLGPGAVLSHVLGGNRAGSVICLRGGKYPGSQVPQGEADGSKLTTVRAADGQTPVFVGEISFEGAEHLRLQGLAFRNGLAFAPSAHDVQLIENDFTGPAGVFFNGDVEQGGETRSILIEGNRIHHIAYSGPQLVYRGYGIKSVGKQSGVTVRNNTIESVAADYIQTDVANDWTVEGNTFLGPSLAGPHPQEHQDLWQDYAGGTKLRFLDNVARNTGTDQSLLFQMTYPGDRFSDVTVRNNLFDEDSRGFSCQLYQMHGLEFQANTIVRSPRGCVFRVDSRYPPGSGYRVDHNIFAETQAGEGLNFEGSADNWGTFDYNVSSDGSALGVHSVRNWTPSWANRVDFEPMGLPFAAGYRPVG